MYSYNHDHECKHYVIIENKMKLFSKCVESELCKNSQLSFLQFGVIMKG